MNKDPQKINLSLVSHTNVGKTTLARTLLGRDIGEVGDRSHVTTEPEDYVLLRAPDDSELILWDTPGFGDSVRLAERLKARSNPIGWFTSEIWDRLTDKSLWLNQQAIKHVRDKSLVILYLVNASESPEAVPYVKAEMDILAWVNKPVIVLLNHIEVVITGLTRNQFEGNLTRVRIPPAAPRKSLFCLLRQKRFFVKRGTENAD